ncbi:MAG: hypothetical protein ACP5UQ_03015 [Anaerolineae bacterium]
MAHWIIDTAGVGSLIVFMVAGSVLIAYALMTRWIVQAPKEHNEQEARPEEVQSS